MKKNKLLMDEKKIAKTPPLISLAEDDLTFLLSSRHQVVYRNFFCLVYKGHVPRAGYILLKGHIIYQHQHRKKKNDHSVEHKGHCLGFKELYYNQTSDWMIFVSSGSQLLILDRSDLQTTLKGDCVKTKQVFENILFSY
jgi:hypothetical protein